MYRKLRQILLFLLAITISLGVVTDVARAQEADPNYWSANDILYYDPTYQQTCAAGGGSLRGANTKEKIWNFLIANDLSPEQAAGIMGNMQEESGFIPSNYQGREEFNLWESGTSGKAWGLVQWDGGRRYSSPDGGILGTLRKEKPELEKYTAFRYDTIGEPNEEFPAADFDAMLLFQLDYLMQESISRDHRSGEGFDGSSDNEWGRLKEQSTTRKAAIYWHWAFERSSDSPSQITERLDAAEAIFNEFKDNLSAAGTGTAGCAAAGSLQELTLAYAWPEYINPRTEPTRARTPTPAYKEATEEPGRYTGGCIDGNCGIDCGAFVTFLITNSGWDPNYNHGGINADGAGPTGVQEAWAQENWEQVAFPDGKIDAGLLQGGDVAFRPGHTFVFVGDIPDFGPPPATKGIASASIGGTWRAPMAGSENPTASDLTWYRKKQ